MKDLFRGLFTVTIGAIPLFMLYPHFLDKSTYSLWVAAIVLFGIGAAIYAVIDGLLRMKRGVRAINAASKMGVVTLVVRDRKAQEVTMLLFDAITHIRNHPDPFISQGSIDLLDDLVMQAQNQYRL